MNQACAEYPNSVRIQPGAVIEPGTVLCDHVQIGANCVVLARDALTGKSNIATIKTGAVVGANSTILPGITVGEYAFVKPGSVVTRSIPPLAIVEGNPAIITGYLSTQSTHTGSSAPGEIGDIGSIESKVRGVTLRRFKYVSDMRGNLTVGEFDREIPFIPARYFLVFDVPTAETRGEHAHRECAQFLVCVKGSCNVIVDDGRSREEFILNAPNLGLYLPSMTWGIQYKQSPDAVLLVFASHPYNPIDYIRDYSQFLALANLN